MGNNITYLLGAGASYNACPIWKEQGDKMVDLSYKMGWNFDFKNKKKENIDTDLKRLIWTIGEIGFKAREFNTVDTYARKLHLLEDFSELSKLKMAVSVFFSLWTLSTNEKWKQLDPLDPKKRVSEIDPRYINLLATYLERGNLNPKLPDHIKFVTWNYDLQLEGAFSKFCNIDEHDYKSIDQYLSFIPSENRDLSVCHLNGFHGFYGKDNGHNLFQRSDSKSLKDLLGAFEFIVNHKTRTNNFQNYINYAWETDIDLANIARQKANEIFSKTNTLVIIGYSFPPFNHPIDKQLIDSAKNLKRVVFQDPNANTDILTETFGIPKNKIVILDKNMDQFVIPNFREKPIAVY